MAQRAGFKNIQIQSKLDLFEQFEDAYEQSGANSKAEFLRIILDNFLNPEDVDNTSRKKIGAELKQLEADHAIEIGKVRDELKSKSEEVESLKTRLSLYETDKMKTILANHKGEQLRFTNSEGEKINVVIADLPDVFTAILNSVEIS